MERLIVDRIEYDTAVLEQEDSTLVDVPLAELPENISEGNVLLFDGSVYEIDKDAENDLRTQIKKQMNALFVD